MVDKEMPQFRQLFYLNDQDTHIVILSFAVAPAYVQKSISK